MPLLATLRLVFAAPHRAGLPFLAGGLGLAATGLFLSPALVAIGLIFCLFCLYFFRDPERTLPPVTGAIVAPADGRVISVTRAAPPAALDLGDEARWRISIFLSILDVHVNRIPASGEVTRIAYTRGRYLDASLDAASEANERNAIAIALPSGGDLAVVQVAGLVARRIRCGLREGDRVATAERFGIIKFGSRTDLYLPEGLRPWVRVGQRTIGGETILAVLGREP